jgi:hypothetical protein
MGLMSLPSRKPLVFDSPATYQICVQGCMDLNWSDRLGDMHICPATAGADPPVTLLEGELRDQAALAGVINSIYELHLPILLIRRLGV